MSLRNRQAMVELYSISHNTIWGQCVEKSYSTLANETNTLTDPDDDRVCLLIVEDNADLCNFMTDELATRCQVIIASDGQQGWKLAQMHLPDVVISDVIMLQMNGFQLTRLIKTNTATNHIAVMLLIAGSAHESRLEGLQHEAKAYLIKPFDLTELRLTLTNLISYQQKLRVYYR